MSRMSWRIVYPKRLSFGEFSQMFTPQTTQMLVNIPLPYIECLGLSENSIWINAN